MSWPKGQPRSIATKQAISAAMMGNQNALGHKHTFSPEARAKLNIHNLDNQYGRGLKGHKQTPEHIAQRSGPKHYRWQGGKSLKYGPGWFKRKQLALERDDHTCQDCGKTKEELGQEPDVHHKIPYRISQDNNLDNLICLCELCHIRTEREYEKTHCT